MAHRAARLLFSSTTHFSHHRINKNTRSFWSTSVLYKDMIVDVPTMGDSITEGTIVSWTRGVNDHIAEDEVVAVIETDKVR